MAQTTRRAQLITGRRALRPTRGILAAAGKSHVRRGLALRFVSMRARQTQKRPRACARGRDDPLGAGAGFEPTTFRL